MLGVCSSGAMLTLLDLAMTGSITMALFEVYASAKGTTA